MIWSFGLVTNYLLSKIIYTLYSNSSWLKNQVIIFTTKTTCMMKQKIFVNHRLHWQTPSLKHTSLTAEFEMKKWLHVSRRCWLMMKFSWDTETLPGCLSLFPSPISSWAALISQWQPPHCLPLSELFVWPQVLHKTSSIWEPVILLLHLTKHTTQLNPVK